MKRRNVPKNTFYEEAARLVSIRFDCPDWNARIKQIAPLVGCNKRVLDVGCNYGNTAVYLKLLENEVVGLDISSTFVEKCKERGINAFICDIEAEKTPDSIGMFDVVIMTEILEHLFDPLEVLVSKIRPLVKKRGHLIVSVPNCAYIVHRLALLRGKLPNFGEAKCEDTRFRPYNIYHKTLFTKRVLLTTLKLSGFKPINVEPTIRVDIPSMLRIPSSLILKLRPTLFERGFTVKAIKTDIPSSST